MINSNHYLGLPPASACVLDIQNFPLTIQMERILDSYATYILSTKIAVGNFHNAHKLSKQLHSRQYMQIQIPQFTNSADGQMIMVGCLLFLGSPHVKEVFICSNDRIFTSLRNALIFQGKKAHIVNRSKNSIYLNGALLEEKRKKVKKEIENIKDLDESLIDIVHQLIEEKNTPEIQANLLGSRFSQLYGKGVTLFLNQFELGITFIDFLNLNPRLKVTFKSQKHFIGLRESI